MDCREVTFTELEAFKDHLGKGAIKIKTRPRNIMNALHAFFYMAISERHYQDDACIPDDQR